MTISDTATTYKRVTKQRAFKLWLEGKPIALCPVNFRPGFPFAMHMSMAHVTTLREEWPDLDPYSGYWPNQAVTDRMRFDRYVASFMSYNCTCNETGMYAAFYATKERA